MAQRRGLIRSSTRAFWKAGRAIPEFTWFDFVHGYVYARWPYFYIGMGTGEHRLARLSGGLVRAIQRLLTRVARKSVSSGEQVTFADTYHGKVVPLDAVAQLVTIREPIHLPDLEQVIPYTRARAIVMENPNHIVTLDCPCRVVRENPCLPLDVCLIVGQPFADFVLEHHPGRARAISQEQAVAILMEEDARGHVHHAFFKDAMLGRFYAICNCCACCCGAMQAHRSGTPMLAASGYRCQVDRGLCVACGVCAPSCQFDALKLQDESMTVDAEACMGCGVCVSKCAAGALSLVRDPAKGIPLEINALMAEALAVELPDRMQVDTRTS